jgi:predicted enzyme related to lactoylglutathione lyase
VTLRIDWVTIDARDVRGLADFWSRALAFDIVEDADADEEILLAAKDGSKRRVLIGRTSDGKVVKNRLHLDLRPDDQAAEVARLESLGAKRVDIGQPPDVTWVVMADPEGNEFCVLRTLRDDERESVPWGD